MRPGTDANYTLVDQRKDRPPPKRQTRVRVPPGAPGALAQLGERQSGRLEVAGSSPACSTKIGSPTAETARQGTQRVGSNPTRSTNSEQPDVLTQERLVGAARRLHHEAPGESPPVRQATCLSLRRRAVGQETGEMTRTATTASGVRPCHDPEAWRPCEKTDRVTGAYARRVAWQRPC